MDDFEFFEDDAESVKAAALTQQSLVDTQNQLGAMLDVMPIGLLIHTEQGVLFANKEACRLLTVTKREILGHHLLDYIRSADIEKISQQLRSSFLGEGKTFEQESTLQRPDGSQRLVKLISGRLPWDGNPVIQLLFQDITDQRRAEFSMRQLTITDELTGAYNRRHANYEAALYICADAATRLPLSVIMVDIDHFKRVNDTYGHPVGDIALKHLTRLAHDFVPTIEGTDSALFARMGGEEFIILLPGVEIAAAGTVAERFRRAVQNMSIALLDGELKFTISLGVASYRDADCTFDGLLGRADAALYDAKAGGRNLVRLAG
ncbi:MAG: sensor diguanylate cyclase [Devosia sp.]|uniref:sensor domain-containing diguanylate cyclase n=1 Tax=Devosia sp. TaxID=1871048 RepID=UPI00260EA584|nr:sensor domain-containing diguanylate cyclase [Devosia sp.]MDB5529596.1 sensor diguanylate cyclase [Devosia sp.]